MTKLGMRANTVAIRALKENPIRVYTLIEQSMVQIIFNSGIMQGIFMVGAPKRHFLMLHFYFARAYKGASEVARKQLQRKWFHL